MLWEMIDWGARVYEAFDSIDPELHYVTDKKTGKKSVDVRLVPARMAEENERPPRSNDCPEVMYSLMQSCWVGSIEKRPAAAEVLLAMQKMNLIEGAMQPPAETADDASGDTEPESMSYATFLKRHSVEDKREALAEWDVKEKSKTSEEAGPLEKLQVMLQEEEDDEVEDFADMLEEIFDGDDEAQMQFRQAVEQLRDSSLQAADGAGGLAEGAWDSLLEVLQLDGAALEEARKSQGEAQSRNQEKSRVEELEAKLVEMDERYAKMERRWRLSQQKLRRQEQALLQATAAGEDTCSGETVVDGEAELAAVTFDRAHANIALSEENAVATRTEYNGTCRTAASGAVLKGGGRYMVQLTVQKGDDMLFGLIGAGWDVEGGQDAHWVQGHCFYDWATGNRFPDASDWEGRQAAREEGDRIGLLLDLDAGSLTVYKNDALLGVMQESGLTDAAGYCWAVAMGGSKGDSARIDAVPVPAPPTAEELAQGRARAEAFKAAHADSDDY
eukprot:COSAG06_NODE_1163_length_10454_cov_16.507677_11_plen_501_part_00